jgi:hypothetical protein
MIWKGFKVIFTGRTLVGRYREIVGRIVNAKALYRNAILRDTFRKLKIIVIILFYYTCCRCLGTGSLDSNKLELNFSSGLATFLKL